MNDGDSTGGTRSGGRSFLICVVFILIFGLLVALLRAFRFRAPHGANTVRIILFEERRKEGKQYESSERTL